MLLYYITDRTQFPGDEAARRRCLLEKIAEAVRCGVDYIQLREKDLRARELEILARQAVQIIRAVSATRATKTKLLINSRTDLALAVGADGVHLPANEIAPSEVRNIWKQCGSGALIPFAPDLVRDTSRSRPMIAVSCHASSEVARAAENDADFAVIAPIFEKSGSPSASPLGLEALRQACRYKIPVFALGGITLDNARACVSAGAAGIAAIRLFQENDVAEVVRTLRD